MRSTTRLLSIFCATALTLAMTIPTTGAASSARRATIKGDTYVINAADDTVLVIESKWKKQDGEKVATSKVVDTIEGFNGASDLTVGDTHLWVANSGSNTVSKIDRETNEIVSEIKVGANARSVELFNDRSVNGSRKAPGALVGVLHSKRNVALIDAETDAVLGTVKVGKNPLRIRGDSFAPHLVSVNKTSYTVIDADAAVSRSSSQVGRSPTKNYKNICKSGLKLIVASRKIGEFDSTLYHVTLVACARAFYPWLGLRDGGDSGGADEGHMTQILVSHDDPTVVMTREIPVPTPYPTIGVLAHFEEFLKGFGAASFATLFDLDISKFRGFEGATAYSIWEFGPTVTMLGEGEILTQNFFADESGSARGNGDGLVVGPINCPNPAGVADPFCGPGPFAKALKSVAKAPNGGNFVEGRLGPELIPDPPFGK